MFTASVFPGCCGILVFHELSGTDYNEQDLRRAIYGLTEAEGNNYTDFDDPDGTGIKDLRDDPDVNLILASTIPSQTNAIKHLTTFGFHQIVTFPGKSGNPITLWGFDKTEYKKCPVDPPAVVFEPVIPKPTKASKPITPMSTKRTKRTAPKATKKRTAKRR